VIAAGRGDRLAHDSHTLKPLVRVGGQTLIERVLLSLAEVRPSEVVIIVNETSLAVKDHVTNSRKWPFAVRWIVETTPSSMHSFLRVVETLAEDGDDGPFLISTVDTIAAPGAFRAFAAASGEPDADVTLAVMRPTDDDKPLLVRVGPDGATVEAIGETVRLDPDTTSSTRAVGTVGAARLPPSSEASAFAEDLADRHRLDAGGPADRDDLQEEVRRRSIWATAGYYAVRSSVLHEADGARRDGVSALRRFFERLLVRGYRLHAVPVAGGIDVDRPADVRAAETFLKQVGASCG
jgi:NDP-sugar pyrophosphorylase family protein